MENTTPLPEKPILVDAPPTVEYIEPKKNWKRIIEICAVIVIISIPVILSLFKIDYSVKRVYEVVNPAYIGAAPDYGTWGSIVTAAEKIIQPVIHLPKNQSIIHEEPTATPTPSPMLQIDQEQQQQEQQLQNSEQSSPSQNQNEIHSPSQTEEPTATPTASPTPTLTATPVPENAQQNYSNNDQVDVYAAYTACYGKKSNVRCSYQSSYGDKITGKCLVSDGHLICVH